MTDHVSILVFGAGELGMAVLQAFAQKNNPSQKVTVLLRPETASLDRHAAKVAPIYLLDNNTQILSHDLVASSAAELAEVLQHYNVVIGCIGYDKHSTQGGDGLQKKIAHAVIRASDASNDSLLYIPWQFGVDYDLFDYGVAGGLFDEQKDIRRTLREADVVRHSKLRWMIISTGIFMSYLFSDFWGVVQKEQNGDGWVVNALGSWDTSTTITTAADIGRLTVEIVGMALREGPTAKDLWNRPVFIGGDTLSYEELVAIIAEATGHPCRKGELLDMEQLTKALTDKPSDTLCKYRVAFGRGKGVSWPIEKTFNHAEGLSTQSAQSWAQSNLI